MSSPLPEYERPPVEEVAIGVQFEPLPKLTPAHLGDYWSKIRDRYPHTEEQPPLLPVIETRDPGGSTTRGWGPGFPHRCWFLDDTKNELIQVQRDRFLRNWRQIKGDERYPRFPYLIEQFKTEWQRFLAFLVSGSLGEVKVNQCEVSYVNHLERGAGWEEFAELSRVFTAVREPAPGFLPGPELQAWDARYRLPDGRGRLHVEAKPILRARDLKLSLAFNLTARGAPGNGESVLAWFDIAHEWIVRGFDQLTTSEMHAIWGKK